MSSLTTSGPHETKAQWWRPVPETGRIVCDLCPRECHLKPGDRGFCFVRANQGGEMVLTTYGRSTGFCIDPIEKKPLAHFYPGTSVLSFGTAGCNLGCKFCQNWDISKSREVAKLSQQATPEAIATAARDLGCTSVAFTYNDPVIWAEYAIDTARECRRLGVKTVAVTAGYISPGARGPFYEYMDAANVDLKAFSEDFYWHLTQSHIEPVLDTLRWLKRETDVWFEITNLIIPQANDSPDELRRMCRWVLDELGDDVPVHFTAFHPDFRLRDRPPTPHETLLAAYDIARSEGMKYMYVGNVHDRRNSSTHCPACGETLIERDWHVIHAYRLNGDCCAKCGHKIPGRFGAAAGTWGARRLPVDMSRYALPLPGDQALVQLAPPTANASLPRPTPSVAPMKAAVAAPPAEVSLDQLTESQRVQIVRAASAFVAATALGLQPSDVGDFDGAANWPVFGAFVTLKRQGRLRGCVGHLGGGQLLDSVRQSAAKSALEDHRFPPVSPGELPFLEIDVSLLHNFAPVPGPAAERLERVVPGKHGVVLKRGTASGLFLPQVAAEHGWSAEHLLRELCAKAGLPTTAWHQDDAQLFTFEGYSITGPLDFGSPIPLPAARFSAANAESLAEHCRQNLLALLAGSTAMYYQPGGADGSVQGLSISVLDANAGELATGTHFELIRGMPLQMTAFKLVEALANNLRQRGGNAQVLAECRIALSVFSDIALLGTSGQPDLRGYQPSRQALILHHGQRWSWAFDQRLAGEKLLDLALEALRLDRSENAGLMSAEVASNQRQVFGTIAPRPVMDVRPRRPAVAGTFYPGEAQEMNRWLDGFFAKPPVTALVECSALLVPHAGWRFSGRLAADVFASARLPEDIIVIGPKHTPHGVDWALSPHTSWELPGGQVAGNQALAQKLFEAIPDLEFDAAAHAQEHAIEVELPMIARLAPQARVVGIVMAGGTLDRLRKMAVGLAAVMRSLPRLPLVVVSSDMNHFAGDAETRELDALALAQLERLDAEGLFQTCHQHHISMCGMLPAVVTMLALTELGLLGSCRRIGYGTSADTTGDTSRVVGYAGLAFLPGPG